MGFVDKLAVAAQNKADKIAGKILEEQRKRAERKGKNTGNNPR